jgi:hypothetical protein
MKRTKRGESERVRKEKERERESLLSVLLSDFVGGM